MTDTPDSNEDVITLTLLPDQLAVHRYFQAALEAMIALPEGENLTEEQRAELWKQAHQ